MDAQLVEQIVNEVVQRILRQHEKRKALVLSCEDDMDTSLISYLDELKANGYSLSQCRSTHNDLDSYGYYFNQEERIDDEISRSELKKIVVKYDTIIIAKMNVGQLSSLCNLQISDNELIILFEGLRLNKEICVFSQDILVESASVGLKIKVDELVEELKILGIKFPGFKTQNNVMLEKSVINKQDIIDLMGKVLLIDSKAIITASARTLLKERGVEIVRK